MLRPSRPMIRPFISSFGSSTRRVVVSLACVAASRCIATARMLRARRSASRLVSSSISLQRQAGLVARLVLDVREQHLLRLRGGEPGDPLELAALARASPLQLLGLLLEVALAILERLHAALELGALDLERLGLAQRPLLHPRDLLAAGAQLVGEPVGRWRLASARRRPARLLGRSSAAARRRGVRGRRASVLPRLHRVALLSAAERPGIARRVGDRRPPRHAYLARAPARGRAAGCAGGAPSSSLPHRGSAGAASQLGRSEFSLKSAQQSTIVVSAAFAQPRRS